ncbi:uncharacterized protein LOC142632479 [Castanea sativa]|uniref:uncharacterized protein LOC142632479 n=1 Tax=Castanea sativa TaxID=21020 RepID=UPI003F64FBE2
MVSTLIDCDTRRWKADLVKSLFFPFEARTILNIQISYNLPEDKIIWVGNNKGVFTVKSAYYMALNMVDSSEEGESSYGDPRDLLWRKVWHLHIPSKVRIFAWRACVDALPTMVNLQNRGIWENDLCPCCGKDSEMIFHSLVNCEVARRVWDNWESQVIENWNQVAFESICQLPSQIWSFAKRYLHDYRGARLTLSMSPAAKNSRWTPPPPGVLKIKVDGATSEDGINSSVGAIIRDSCGAVIGACCKYLQGQYSVAEVEAIAVESGILLARHMRISQVIIELDADLLLIVLRRCSLMEVLAI